MLKLLRRPLKRVERLATATMINAGTGLESPIIFLDGTNEMFELEKSLRLSEEERRDLMRENTRKLYMAFTRAGQRLIVTYRGELPKSLQELIQPNDA